MRRARADRRQNGLADVGGSGERMRQWAGIDQGNFVSAFSQFNRSNNTFNARANHDCLLHPALCNRATWSA